MSRLSSSYRWNLDRLARFSGRDTAAQFWPWAISVFLCSFGASMVVMAMAMMGAMMESMKAARGEIPMQKAAHATADLGWLWMPLALFAAIAVLLLAGSVARRLHDVGWRGAWGLVPLPFLATSIAYTGTGFRFAAGEDLSEPPIAAFLSGPLFYITLIALAVLLARRGLSEANRFGPVASN